MYPPSQPSTMSRPFRSKPRYCARFILQEDAAIRQSTSGGDDEEEPPAAAGELSELAGRSKVLDADSKRVKPSSFEIEPAEGARMDGGEDERRAHKIVEEDIALCRRRLKVGFLSAYFFHHSVGLLVEGVVTRLDRRRFETTAIFLQPHPSAASLDEGGNIGAEGGGRSDGGDGVYKAVRSRTEHVLDVPASRCGKIEVCVGMECGRSSSPSLIDGVGMVWVLFWFFKSVFSAWTF